MKAWHFVGGTLRDGSPVPADGVKLVHAGRVIPCKSGLHASEHPFDALQFAPGPVLCLVKCGGIVVPHGSPVDKIACSERTIIARMDATPLLRYFARQQALSVAHLMDSPPDVVLDFLMCDDTARAAAWTAAWAAAWTVAARDAARAAAARDAAGAAAWAAAWTAARDVARTAAWAAAWAAAGDVAARDAARDAAWAAARDVARTDFAALVQDAFEDYL